VSLQNLFPRASLRGLVVTVSVLATAGALAINLRSYSQFLYLLGAFFVPLLGVLVADWLAAGAHYEERDVFEAPAFRPANIAAWVTGFVVYEWLAQPSGLGFWTRALSHLPTPSYAIGASIPSFVCAFVLASAAARVARLGSARAVDRRRREPLARSR
jgi:purine-cytosine permease-like protein